MDKIILPELRQYRLKDITVIMLERFYQAQSQQGLSPNTIRAKVLVDGKLIHTARHTAITALIQNGENPVNVSKMAGHTKTSFTLDIYSHAIIESKTQTADTLANAMNKLANK